MGYITNFIVYTLAMVGVIVVALLVFKNATMISNGAKSKHLKVLDTLQLAPRKSLYVISTGTEKFLIAGDVNTTTLISKLETKGSLVNQEIPNNTNLEVMPADSNSFQQTITHLANKTNYMDKTNIGINLSMLSEKKSVMRNLAERIK